MSLAQLIDAVFEKTPEPPAGLYIPTCSRCEQVASFEEKNGRERSPVQPVETWVGPNGMRYVGGLCFDCTNMAWSRAWDRRYGKAPSTELLEEVKRFEARGRVYVGTKRPGGATTKHMTTCRCASCRTAAADEAAARSLFPEGQAG